MGTGWKDKLPKALWVYQPLGFGQAPHPLHRPAAALCPLDSSKIPISEKTFYAFVRFVLSQKPSWPHFDPYINNPRPLPFHPIRSFHSSCLEAS
jgi:hypothetical protein